MAPPPSFNSGALVKAAKAAGIINTNELAMFTAQMAHESGGFQYDEEIASGKDYEGRSNLGNTQKGDGEKFKGRGYIQLTGRANYKEYGDKLGINLVDHPEKAKDPEVAAAIAVQYWKDRVKSSDAQSGNVEAVTYAINGGHNGLEDRRKYFEEYKKNLPTASAVTPPTNSSVATASAGISLPSASSVSAIVFDLRTNNQKDAADKLEAIVANYAKRDGKLPEAEKQQIVAALDALQKHITDLFVENKIELTDKNQMMAVHLGPFSSLVALKTENGETPVSKASFKDGKGEYRISKEAYDKFAEELKGAGIEVAAYDIAKIKDLKAAAEAFYIKQKDEAQKTMLQQQSGDFGDLNIKENADKKKNVDFFTDIIKQTKETNPILGLIMEALSWWIASNKEAEKTPEKALETPAPATPSLPKLPNVTGGGNVTTPTSQELPAKLSQVATRQP